jgi:hypothetical protein
MDCVVVVRPIPEGIKGFFTTPHCAQCSRARRGRFAFRFVLIALSSAAEYQKPKTALRLFMIVSPVLGQLVVCAPWQ